MLFFFFVFLFFCFIFFFQAEDGIRDFCLSRGLGDVYKRQADLCGIVNGIDYDIYNPSTDEYIPCHYDEKTFDKGKKKNKAALQEKAGLPKKRTAFTLGIVSRLTEQKGCLLYTSPSPRDRQKSRMPSSA